MADVRRVFFDTTVLVGGLLDVARLGLTNPAQRVLNEVAAGRIDQPSTAWHCCLEFFSVVTRLPEEVRLRPEQARTLIEHEILGRFDVFELPPAERNSLFTECARDGLIGGRLYDRHIALVGLHAGASVFVTDNLRHFGHLASHGVVVRSSQQFLDDYTT